MKNTQNITEPTPEERFAEIKRLFKIVDPETGERYDIPLLSSIDGDYFFKYAYYMEILEDSPETFEQILNWN
ncbi:MAG: hypothetical protein ISR69_15075 [Gammaproteobacteria bacterium]|nr:hypothetical protein [Gammaproteobacteria bacterium]